MEKRNKNLLDELNELETRHSKVTQRTKKDPIKVDGYIDAQCIPLKIIATSEAWGEMRTFYLEKPGLFASDIYSQFIEPVVGVFGKRAYEKKLRGKHKGSASFVDEIKISACWLNAFLSYWSKKQQKEYPACIRFKIDKVDKSKIIKTSGKFKPIALTAYILEKIYGKEMKRYNIYPFFNNLENFRITYIQGCSFHKKIAAHIKNASYNEIKNIHENNAYLRVIFREFDRINQTAV